MGQIRQRSPNKAENGRGSDPICNCTAAEFAENTCADHREEPMQHRLPIRCGCGNDRTEYKKRSGDGRSVCSYGCSQNDPPRRYLLMDDASRPLMTPSPLTSALS